MPDSTRMSVDLPAPFSPTIAWISPGATSRDASRFATTGPNVLTMPDAEIADISRNASSRARHLDASGDALLAQRFDAGTHRIRNQRAIVLIVHVVDTMLRETELEDAALEGAVLHILD